MTSEVGEGGVQNYQIVENVIFEQPLNRDNLKCHKTVFEACYINELGDYYLLELQKVRKF